MYGILEGDYSQYRGFGVTAHCVFSAEKDEHVDNNIGVLSCKRKKDLLFAALHFRTCWVFKKWNQYSFSYKCWYFYCSTFATSASFCGPDVYCVRFTIKHMDCIYWVLSEVLKMTARWHQ